MEAGGVGSGGYSCGGDDQQCLLSVTEPDHVGLVKRSYNTQTMIVITSSCDQMKLQHTDSDRLTQLNNPTQDPRYATVNDRTNTDSDSENTRL